MVGFLSLYTSIRSAFTYLLLNLYFINIADKEQDPIVTIAELKSHLKSMRKILKEKMKLGTELVKRRNFGTGSGADVLEDAMEEEFDEDELEDEDISKMNLQKWWDAAHYLRPYVAVRNTVENLNIDVSSVYI